MPYGLFVCAHNAGRSQIAQALFKRSCPGDRRGESAGSDPAGGLGPDDVPIPSHILTLAHKETRACLQDERCELHEPTVR